ncbi:VanZ-like domain-containing protein [Sphingomonas antarctica]|uniref:hypothetical protein n=1 Tax=Sphingomonas antarctica TaxID=2040274 RepID=UPI0039E7441B
MLNRLLANAHVTRAFRVLFVAAMVLAVVLALLPAVDDPFANLWDKLKHALTFGVLVGLAAFGWRQTPLLRIGERLSFLGALIEVFQSIPALHRDCDPKDWLADTLAIAVALIIIKATGLRDDRPQI